MRRRRSNGFGTGFAGRGRGLNVAIEELNPLLTNLRPVAANLAAPRTRLDRLFPSLGAAAGEIAPVAELQRGAVREPRHRTFAALAGGCAPVHPGVDLRVAADARDRDRRAAEAARVPAQLRGAVPRAAAGRRPRCRPPRRCLPTRSSSGRERCPQTPALNRRLASVFDSLAEFAEDPLVPLGVRRLRDTVRSLRPTVAFLAPAQTQCNYVTLWFRNVASVLSEGDSNGTWQRFIIIAAPVGPNSEGTPSSNARRTARRSTTTCTPTRTRTRRRRVRPRSARPATRTTWSARPRSATCPATRA